MNPLNRAMKRTKRKPWNPAREDARRKRTKPCQTIPCPHEWCAGWWAGKVVGYTLGAEATSAAVRRVLR